MIGVTALSGMMPPPPGSTQNKLHAKATTAPIKTATVCGGLTQV